MFDLFKKKNKTPVINNYYQTNMEIDYDRLAEAIVRAQAKNDLESNKSNRFTSGTFALIVALFFRGVAISGWIISFFSLSVFYRTIISFDWSAFSLIANNVVQIIFILCFVAVLFLFSLLLWKSAKEIEKEKDRNYIISVFSGVVSFAALIVALVALFKGVG